MTVEIQLFKRAANRDTQTFAELYDRCVDKIYKYFYYTTRTTSDAEDMTSQVFSHACQAIAENRLIGEPLATWLYRLAHRKLIDYCQARHRTGATPNPLIITSGNVRPVVALGACASSQIRVAMQHLTRDQQEVIVLRFLEGYSAAQVAVLINIGPDAVRVIQQDALQALEPWLGDESDKPKAKGENDE